MTARLARIDLRHAAVLVGPPLAACVLGRLVIAAAAIHAGVGWPGVGDLTRGDAHNYVSIAEHGYSVYYCTTACPPGLPAGWWGNTHWLPLYPILIAPFSAVGLSGEATGAVLSALFDLAALSLLWIRFVRPCRPIVGAAVLATAALFPGAVYLQATFPLSLLALLFLIGIAELWERRWTRAGIVGGLATATYPLGIVLPPVAAIWALALPGGRRERANRAAWICVPPAVVLLAFYLAQRLMTGYWDAFSKLDAHFDQSLRSPVAPLWRAKAETLSFLEDRSRLDLTPSVQVLVSFAIVVAAVAGWAISRRRNDLLVLGIVVAAWLVPLVAGGVNAYRTDAALLPALILTRRLPVAIQLVLLALSAITAFLLATLFFENRLE